MIILIPISYYIRRIDKLYLIKYMYVMTYYVVTTFDDVITFMGTSPESYKNGNVAEITLLLFAPIFINNKFFLTVTIAIILKYSLIGLLLGNGMVMAPIVLVFVFALITYILLARFNSYTKALTETHEELRDKEKLAFVGQMATTIGHEIRNPLASLKGSHSFNRKSIKRMIYSIRLWNKKSIELIPS